MEGFIKIPNDIKIDKELSWFAKVMFGEILSLSRNGSCTASLQYFMDTFNIKRTIVFITIKALKAKGLIDGNIGNLTVQKFELNSSKKGTDSSKKGTQQFKNLNSTVQKNELNSSKIGTPYIYSIIDNLIDKKKIKKRPSEELINTFIDFIKFREEIKKPLTEVGIKTHLVRVCSQQYESIGIRMIQRSIENNRQGLFDLNDDELQKIKQKEKAKVPIYKPPVDLRCTIDDSKR